MAKSTTKSKTDQAAAVLLQQEEPGTNLLEFILLVGPQALYDMIEQEIVELCGPRYRNIADRVNNRWGKTVSPVVLGGKKVQVERPRVRNNKTGKEIPLQTIKRFQQEDLLNKRQLEEMLIGVSTRKYRRSEEAHLPNARHYSNSKSSVSRRFVIMTMKRLREWRASPITEQYPILMIDATVIHKTTVTIVLGINCEGDKCVLGAWEGSTENARVCKDLLNSLVERGLDPEAVKLLVLDGGKAIRKAANDLFGTTVFVQRCQFHKIQNVMSYLSLEEQASVRRAMLDAYGAKDYATARQILENLQRALSRHNENAARSLAEGMEETLTLLKLKVTGNLYKSLKTTNLIESLNSRIKNQTARVKRWRSPNMVIRWVYTGIAEAEKGFRRIRGYRKLETLLTVIDFKLSKQNPLENENRVA